MTTARDALLLKIAEDIADGRTIDWMRLDAEVDTETLANLRDIAALAGQFGTVNATAAPAAQPVLSLWAHLELLEEIGRGATGMVYRAFDPLLQRQVALKLCNPNGGQPDDLLREARQMAKVDHPGVLKIHGVQSVDGQVGFWSNLVEGESIAARLERERRIPAHEVVTIGLEICAALSAIHGCDLVHGDVKAQNVVRDRDGPHVLVDFGSARNSYDRTGISGTPFYLPPERLKDVATSQADDFYSLGVLLFRMLSGQFPVEAASLDALADAHARGQRRHLLDLLPRIDPRLAAVVERAIDPDPARRYPRAGEFAAALGTVLPAPTAAPVPAPSPVESTPADDPRPFWLRARAGLGIAVALMIAVGAGLWIARDDGRSEVVAQARLMRSSGGVVDPLLDGDRVAVGDALSLELQLSRDAHVYVFNEDATGAVYQLFPLPLGEMVNPLPGGRRLRLPGRVAGRDLDWQVTSVGARERFYLLTSPAPIADLAPASTGFALAEAGRPLDRSALVAAAMVTRGVGGLEERDAAANARYDVGAWLVGVREQHPGATLQQFELDNPLPGGG